MTMNHKQTTNFKQDILLCARNYEYNNRPKLNSFKAASRE